MLKDNLLILCDQMAIVAPPLFDAHNDPRGWFANSAPGYVVDDDYHLSLLKVANDDVGYTRISRDQLRRGDIVQAKVSFAPYMIPSKAAGLNINLEELMVIRGGNELVMLRVSSTFQISAIFFLKKKEYGLLTSIYRRRRKRRKPISRTCRRNPLVAGDFPFLLPFLLSFFSFLSFSFS